MIGKTILYNIFKRGEKMNKKIFFVTLLFVFFFSSCQTNEKTIQSVSIDDVSMVENYNIDEFAISDFILIIEYSDGSILNINVSENMLSDSDLAKLNTIGNHTIDIFYQGFKVSVDLNIVYANHTLTLMLINIYETGINEGDIDGLSYEEWLESIRGEKGKDGVDGTNGTNGVDGSDGRDVLFQVSEGYIQWQYTGDTTWTNLVSLSTLKGSDGVDGTNGTDGVDGTNGTNGVDGSDGRDVLFQVSDGYIQWQYSGDTSWTNLISLETLLSLNNSVSNEYILIYTKTIERSSDISLYEFYLDEQNKEILIKLKKTFIGDYKDFGIYYYEYYIYPTVTKFNSEINNWVSYNFLFEGYTQLSYDYEDEEWSYSNRDN